MMRFRKRVKVFPGFHLNFSNSGVSSTIGVRGASINFSKRGTYLNTGIPGTGFHSRQRIGGHQDSASFANDLQPIKNEETIRDEILIGEIKSGDTNSLTSSNLVEVKETLLEAYRDRIELRQEIQKTMKQISNAKTNYLIARLFIIGFIVKSFKEKIMDREDYLADIQNQLNESFVNIDIYFEREFEEKYIVTSDSYKSLLTSQIIWDVTSSVRQDMEATRSAASHSITRMPVRFKFDNIDIIKSSVAAFHFENKNGGDLYIYPAFVIVSNSSREFALIDIKDIEMKFSEQLFLEEEKVPSDTKIIDKTWAKVNKDGSRDKRFTDNYQIPIVSYGEIEIKSSSGLNETYAFSNYEKSKGFAEAFAEYQNTLN